MEKPFVCWLPADPVLGGPSMLRWWRCLAEEAGKATWLRTGSVLGAPPELENTAMPGRVRRALRKYVSIPLRVKMQRKADLFHLLDHSWAHLLDQVPAGTLKVATVHDLIPLRYPDRMTANQVVRWKHLVGKIRCCDCIVADSAYTKSEITALLGISADRIEVVPLGVDLAIAPPTAGGKVSSALAQLRETAGVDMIIGCLGSGLGRKNLQVVPKGVELLERRGIRAAVVRAGPPLPSELRGDFRRLTDSGRFVDFGFLTDAQVNEFYRGIDVQVMPSLYEGFGLPVLEAMAVGTVVLSSNATSLPEVAGEAALMFDPESPEALAEGLSRLADLAVRKEWSAKGLARAQQFSWSETWRRYEAIYRRLLPGGH